MKRLLVVAAALTLVAVPTSSSLHVGASFWLRPLGGSVRIMGPTYTTR